MHDQQQSACTHVKIIGMNTESDSEKGGHCTYGIEEVSPKRK